MTQIEFRLSKRGATQNERLRDCLLSRPGVWIEMPELVRIIGSYVIHSRIADCRKLFGMTIEQRSDRVEGMNHSFYRYVPNAG